MARTPRKTPAATQDIARWALGLRAKADMSQVAWARACGLSVATVSRIERGLLVPHRRTIYRMFATAEALQATQQSEPS